MVERRVGDKMAEDEQNSTVNTANDEEQKRKEKQQEKEQKKPRFNIISFIVKHFAIIWKVALILFFILFVIGIIQLLITMPGFILGKIKEYSANFLSIAEGWLYGDNISAKISKEDEIEMAQYIQDMGYDVLGYGFGEVTYEEDSSETGKTGLENSTITNLGRSFLEGMGDVLTGKTVTNDYIKAYMVQNEATYTLATWNLAGVFESFVNGGSSRDYSKGMIHVTREGREISSGYLDGYADVVINAIKDSSVSVDRQRKLLRIRMGGISGFLSQAYYYFNMANWTSRYGKPLELFLALHLASMMPDLTYDLATAECFNTKVNIDLQKVDTTYTVSYKANNGEVVEQEEIEKIYLNARWGISTNYTGEDFEKFVGYVMDYSKKSTYNSSKGIDLTYIEHQMNGEEAKEEDDDFEEVQSIDSNGNPQVDRNGDPITTRVKKTHTFSGPENAQSEWQPTIDASKLAGIKPKELQGFMNLIDEGKKTQIAYWPRITNVVNHWYYNEIIFKYGRAGKAYKRIKYAPDDTNNELYGVDGIVLNATLTSNSGVYYQLCEPEMIGPNQAIIDLFKGGSGTLDGIAYDFEGEYYRYDGSRDTAKKILNAKSGSGGYIFGGKTYPKEEVTVYKEPVSFYDQGEGEKNSYKNAYSAFAILERANSEEAEACYRNLKELLVYLDYFSVDDLKDPYYKVLIWFMPGNIDRDNVIKDANKYGIVLKNSAGQEIIAPGNGRIISVDGNSVTIKFTKLDSDKVASLNQRFADDFYSVDENCVLDLEMVISGITPSVSVGQYVTGGTSIGTASEDEVQVYMKNVDGSIIDDVTKYMSLMDSTISLSIDVPTEELQMYAHELCMEYGWTEYDFECLVNLWNKESRWIPTAENASGAYGIPQKLGHDDEIVR